MSRLVVFGCSLSFGTGLPDCWSEDSIPEEPSKFAWPQLLADKLGIECVNLSEGGNSNKQIDYDVLNAEIKPDDIVIVQWSYMDRWCIIREDTIDKIFAYMVYWDKIKDSSKKFNKDAPMPGFQKMATSFFGDLHSAYDMNADLNMRMQHTWTHLNHIGVRQLHMITHGSFKRLPFNNVPVDEQLSISKLRDRFPLALDGSHPGLEAHAAFAEQVFEELTREN